MRYLLISIALFTLFSCASKDGDKVDCPSCNNTTEILVGTKCVSISEIEACGPDGHAHGTECHCFRGQLTTKINGKEYCLQQGCGSENSEEQTEDVDKHACEAAKGTKESVESVDSFEKFDEVHLELETFYEVTLKAGKESFVHTGPATTGDWAVYMSDKAILDSAYNAKKEQLEIKNMGQNPDCETVFPDVFHVFYTEKEGMGPAIVLKFKAQAEDKKVTIFIHEASDEHE